MIWATRAVCQLISFRDLVMELHVREVFFFPCWLGNENRDARDEEVMKHFSVWSLFWLGEICARVNIATLLLRCTFWM